MSASAWGIGKLRFSPANFAIGYVYVYGANSIMSMQNSAYSAQKACSVLCRRISDDKRNSACHFSAWELCMYCVCIAV